MILMYWRVTHNLHACLLAMVLICSNTGEQVTHKLDIHLAILTSGFGMLKDTHILDTCLVSGSHLLKENSSQSGCMFNSSHQWL